MARGFELAVKQDMNQLFGMNSILFYISKNLLNGAGTGGGLKKLYGISPVMLLRLLRARYRSHRDEVPILPKDIFKLDAFVCVGNDSTLYKTELGGLSQPLLVPKPGAAMGWYCSPMCASMSSSPRKRCSAA
jgi:hypothetical protein